MCKSDISEVEVLVRFVFVLLLGIMYTESVSLSCSAFFPKYSCGDEPSFVFQSCVQRFKEIREWGEWVTRAVEMALGAKLLPWFPDEEIWKGR